MVRTWEEFGVSRRSGEGIARTGPTNGPGVPNAVILGLCREVEFSASGCYGNELDARANLFTDESMG
jgi:hypothetical protein